MRATLSVEEVVRAIEMILLSEELLLALEEGDIDGAIDLAEEIKCELYQNIVSLN